MKNSLLELKNGVRLRVVLDGAGARKHDSIVEGILLD
jgi:hypothetical protein